MKFFHFRCWIFYYLFFIIFIEYNVIYNCFSGEELGVFLLFIYVFIYFALTNH